MLRYNRRKDSRALQAFHFLVSTRTIPMARVTARVTQTAKHARKGQRAGGKAGALRRRRRTAGKKRSGRSASGTVKTASRSKSHGRKHTFIASHHRADAFEQGLRRYAHYRDLGIA